MKFRETKFREIILSYFAKFLCLFRDFVLGNIRNFEKFLRRNFGFLLDEAKKFFGDRAGNNSIIFFAIFYIMKWWRHKFPWENTLNVEQYSQNSTVNVLWLQRAKSLNHKWEYHTWMDISGLQLVVAFRPRQENPTIPAPDQLSPGIIISIPVSGT
jgi:hypothetical protein